MRTLPLVSLALATAPGAAQITSAGPTSPTLADSLATWYALGINAHHLCSGLWVVGRDNQRTPETVIADDIARYPGRSRPRWTGRSTMPACGGPSTRGGVVVIHRGKIIAERYAPRILAALPGRGPPAGRGR